MSMLNVQILPGAEPIPGDEMKLIIRVVPGLEDYAYAAASRNPNSTKLVFPDYHQPDGLTDAFC